MSEKDVQRLLAIVERALGAQWLDLGDYLRALPANQLDEIERRLLAYDYTGVIAQIDDAARVFATAEHEAFTQAGQTAADWLDKQPSLKDTLVRYDVANDRAVVAARRNELERVSGLTQEARLTAQRVIIDGQRAGLNPRDIARDLRDTMTLTPTQAQHVTNYRRALETGDYSNALGRELSSGHSDRAIRTAQRDGSALTPQQIDTAVNRYRDNYVAYRAETVARTESARNVHAGIAEAYQQAIDRGQVSADQLVKEWIPGPRTKDARPMHHAHELLAQRPTVTEPFKLSDGTSMMWPGDPMAGPEQVANCRCTYATTLNA